MKATSETCLKVGLVGAGAMGAHHARILAEDVGGCTLSAIADADPDRAQKLAASLGVFRLEGEGIALVRDPSIDAIVIASPDATHFDLVMECLKQRKPVLCEKPLAATSDQCRQIATAEISGGKRLVQVGFMRRFDPGYLDMKTSLEAGTFGQPLLMHCTHRVAKSLHYLNADTIPLSSAVHEIDIARFLLGEEFTKASVRMSRPPRHAPARAPQYYLLETASGVLVDIEIFVDAQYGYDVRAELVMETGTMSLVPPNPSSVRSSGMAGKIVSEDWIRRFDAAYKNQARAWVSSVRTGMPAGASAWDGYVATRFAEECVTSLKEQSEQSMEVEATPAFYLEAPEQLQ